MTLEEVKSFAEEKQRETKSQLDTALRHQQKFGEAFTPAVAGAQRAWMAYTSILEIIAGETPCDPIYNPYDE